MNTYFVSQYLNVINLETSSLLFNGATGAMDEVSKALGEKLRTPRSPFNVGNMSEGEIDYLKRRGHITLLSREEEIDTFKHITRHLHQRLKESFKKQGYIRLLLSYDCNLDCYYCYQRQIRRKNRGYNQTQVMSPVFVKELFTQHFATLFPGVPYERVRVVLCGGEPFLPQHTQGIAKVLELAQNTSIAEVNAVTNGTQLEKMLDFFGPLPGQVNFVQISLDGAQESHDQSRIPRSKAPTFQTIIENVHRLLERNVRVNLRINVSSKSIHTLDKLVELLEKQGFLEHPLLYSYVVPIHVHYDQPDEDGLLSVDEVTNCLLKSSISKHLKIPFTRTIETFKKKLLLQQGGMLKKTSFCMISKENYFIVDSYGNIYKCYEEAGREEYKVGEISKGQVRFLPLLDTYLSRDISAIEKCTTCSVALACGGECGTLAKIKNHDYFTPYCNGAKHMILEAIKYLYQERALVHDHIKFDR